VAKNRIEEEVEQEDVDVGANLVICPPASGIYMTGSVTDRVRESTSVRAGWSASRQAPRCIMLLL